MATAQINDMYEKATLAMAAYADGKTKADLEAIDFSEEQADQFLAKYEYLDKSADTLTGFSGTFYEIKTGENAGDIVFALRGTDFNFSSLDAFFETIHDLTSDANLAIGGVAVNQIMDMVNYYLRAIFSATTDVEQYAIEIIDGQPTLVQLPVTQKGLGIDGLDSSTPITLTGHSLGGHLAQAFVRLFPLQIVDAYTYNGAGINSGQNGFDTLADLLSGVVSPISINPGVSSDNLVTNIIAEPGIDVTPTVGQQIGLAPEYLFIEESFVPISNHSIVALTDALAVYDMLSTLDNSLSIAEITGILYAASNTPEESLEGAINGIIKFLGLSVPEVGIGDRDALYSSVASIVSGGEVENLYSISSVTTDIVSLAALNTIEGQGYRYALVNLLPFVVTSSSVTTAANTAEYNLNDANGNRLYSDAYLADKAKMLGHVINRNTLDTDYPSSAAEGEPIYYGDSFTGESFVTGQIDLPGGAPAIDQFKVKRIVFGDSQNNAFLLGGEKDDHLYGQGGEDTLNGQAGDDYLEGGEGDDIFQIKFDEGNDTIFDTQGANNLFIEHELSGGLKEITGELKAYEGNDSYRQLDNNGNPVNDTVYIKSGDDLIITKPGGGTVTIKNFVASDFGFSLKDDLAPPEIQLNSAVIVPTSIVDLLYPSGWFNLDDPSPASTLQNHFLSGYYRHYRETKYNQQLSTSHDFLNTSYDVSLDVSAANSIELSAIDNAFGGYDSGFESGALVDNLIGDDSRNYFFSMSGDRKGDAFIFDLKESHHAKEGESISTQLPAPYRSERAQQEGRIFS